MKYPTCVLCSCKIDPDAPHCGGGMRTLNPVTFRVAWLHYSCADAAYEDLERTEKERFQGLFAEIM
jgi:hypothetical protein